MTPESIHLIYEIAGTSAIIIGAGWKLISVLNKRFEFYDNKNEARFQHLESRFQNIERSAEQRYDVLCDSLDEINQRVARLHEDMIYVDNDLSNMEEKIIQLEYRPTGVQGTQTPIQPLPQPIRRMRRRRGL